MIFCFFSVFLYYLKVFSSPVQAKDYSFPEVKFEIQIFNDGSFQVNEQRKYHFNGSFSWADLKIFLKDKRSDRVYQITDFKIEDETWCPHCNKKVITVKEGKNADLAITTVLEQLKEIIIKKIEYTTQQLQNEKDIQKLANLSKLISVWLDILIKTNQTQNKHAI